MTKKLFILFFLSIFIFSCNNNDKPKEVGKLKANETSKDFPFGKANEKAPSEIKDFDKLIGNCNCKSVQYNRQGYASDTLDLKWRWKYILNGNGVQDDGWYGNDTIQSAFTSIRVLNPQTKKWMVPFFTPNMTQNPNIWNGGKEGENIVLRRPFTVNDSINIVSTLTFSNITDKGFYWEGKSVFPKNNTESIFWKIWCVKE